MRTLDLILKKVFVLLIFAISTNISANWKKVETIPAPFDNIHWLEVYFLPDNSDYGWVCGFGGSVIRTTDGGDSWSGVVVIDIIDTTIITVNQLESIHFVDSMTGFTSGDDKLFKSIDGGDSWKIISDTGAAIWGNYFLDAQTGWTVGGGCNGDWMFLRTIDGGMNWSSSIVSNEFSGLSDVIVYNADGLGYAVSSGFIWQTLDGGRTWHPFSRSGEVDWQEDMSVFGSSFLVPYSTECLGWGDSGGIRMSIDNGNSWSDFNTGYSMFGAFLIDDNKGWSCGDTNALYYTSDGGINWELKNCGLEENTNIDDLWFINDTLGWGVGTGVYKTHNYGEVFSNINSENIVNLCYGESMTLTSSNTFMFYEWSTGEKSKSIVVSEEGTYSLSAYNHICEKVHPDSVLIKNYPRPEISIMPSEIDGICEGDTLSVWLESYYKTIQWSTGEKKDSIKIWEAGTYYVTIIDSNDCEYSKAFELVVNPLPNPKIEALGRLRFCFGDSTLLRTTESYLEYSWRNLSEPDNILSSERNYSAHVSGIYSVLVKNEFGCEKIADSIEIEVWNINNSLEILSIDFDNIARFDTTLLMNISCLDIRVMNNSDREYYLSEALVYKNIEFSIPQSQFPLLILSGDTIDLEICFKPYMTGERFDTLMLSDTCNPHIIPLTGYCSANVYTAESQCDVDLKFNSTRLSGYKDIELFQPYPNPANSKLVIPFSFVSDSATFSFQYTIYNTYATTILKGKPELVSINKNDNNHLTTGKLEIDVSNISSGIYFLRVSYEGGYRSFPIIID